MIRPLASLAALVLASCALVPPAAALAQTAAFSMVFGGKVEEHFRQSAGRANWRDSSGLRSAPVVVLKDDVFSYPSEVYPKVSIRPLFDAPRWLPRGRRS